MTISADLSGIGSYIGAVQGTLNAVQDPRFKGNFIGSLTSQIRKKFMADAIAANMAGEAHISHVFEWGDQDGEGVATGQPSSVPLFKLTREGTGPTTMLGYEFLPSTKPVPLPNPEKYGFKAEKLGLLRRHVFRLKALVMETQTNVVITPRQSQKLFIPDANNKYGYYMSSNPSNINPGGSSATGGFADFWNTWFDSRAQGIVDEFVKKGEEVIAATGQKVIRYKAGTKINGVAVGGRFATGIGVSIGYINGVEQSSQLMAAAELNSVYNDEWDGEE